MPDNNTHDISSKAQSHGLRRWSDNPFNILINIVPHLPHQLAYNSHPHPAPAVQPKFIQDKTIIPSSPSQNIPFPAPTPYTSQKHTTPSPITKTSRHWFTSLITLIKHTSLCMHIHATILLPFLDCWPSQNLNCKLHITQTNLLKTTN